MVLAIEFGPESYAADEIDPAALDGRTQEMSHAVEEALDLRQFSVVRAARGPGFESSQRVGDRRAKHGG
jgi:hypothetical protein